MFERIWTEAVFDGRELQQTSDSCDKSPDVFYPLLIQVGLSPLGDGRTLVEAMWGASLNTMIGQVAVGVAIAALRNLMELCRIEFHHTEKHRPNFGEKVIRNRCKGLAFQQDVFISYGQTLVAGDLAIA